MSSQDRGIDAGTTDRTRQDVSLSVRCDPTRTTVLAGSSTFGLAGTYDLPDKLIEAWTRWAATRLI